MGSKLTKVNDFLNNIDEASEIKQTNIVLSGPDAIKNILVNETLKLTRLESVTNELLNYLTDHKAIKQLTYKEKQHLLSTITDIQTNSRDFIFKVAELSSKNSFLQEVLKMAQEPKELITSCNGETYISSIDEETRRNLTEILRDVVNERVRNS